MIIFLVDFGVVGWLLLIFFSLVCNLIRVYQFL
jgi:hypothetical protein